MIVESPLTVKWLKKVNYLLLTFKCMSTMPLSLAFGNHKFRMFEENVISI